ncbi:ABC transporter substrate-binding protein [Amycolatopsis sp. MtRt-6]|uniref:ABC transporter substrate-binding protein n=1 Tax=Amycolatopsis sp. MtRt-6 TaxID=2792782 RepID=UPI001A8E8020|nr:ABC transporter substrate-binding protein [Amycolatopsis sp. MtRt-6]
MMTSPRQVHAVRLLWASAVAVVAAAAVTGCSASSQPAAGSGPLQLVSSLPAAKGDVDLITWNLTAGEPDTLFPPNAATYGGGQVVANLCDALVTIDADYHLKPNLATPKQVDPSTLVYTIRDGAKFWDGKPVTAEDVAYSMERAKDPSSIVSLIYQNVQSVSVTGPHEVTVKFSKPDEMFNAEMATIAGMVMEKAFTEQAGKNAGAPGGGLMCSGPFKLDTWTSGDSITISRNDGYWNADRRPFAKRVKFTFVTDTTALVQALNAGEIDGAYELSPSAIPALRTSQAGRLAFGRSMQSVALNVVNPAGPLGDLKLRQALQKIVDRKALATAVYQGAATADYTVLSPATWPNDQTQAYQSAYDTIAGDRAYDIAKAKELVGASGYRGQPLVLAVKGGDESSSRTAQLIQQQAAQAGVKIDITSLTPLVFDQAGYDAGKRQGIDLMLQSSFNGAQDPLEPLGFVYLPGATYNYLNYNDPQVTTLLDEARQTFDGAERAKKVIAAQAIYEPFSAAIPLVGTNTVTFLNNRLTGAVTTFAYFSMPQMAYVGAAG